LDQLEVAAMETSFTQPDPPSVARTERPGFPFRLLSQGHRELLFWIVQILFWTAIGIVGLLMTLAFKASLQGVGWVILLRMVAGFLQTAALRMIYRSPPFRQRSGFAKWPLVIICCATMAIAEMLLLQALLVAGISLPGGAEVVSLRLLLVRLFILTIWSSLYFAFHLLENAHALELRTAKAELAARENELRQLQAQMNPHFLLNALSTVLACKDDAVAVKEVTQGLSDYLRFLLKDTRPLEPLARELDALEKYLTVQASHFGKRLVCRIQCEKAARAVMVPPMLVQPLLEDAFHHHSKTNGLPLQIWVTAAAGKDFLRINVSNTTEQIPSGEPPTPGGGLRALEQRLALLPGPKARVERQTDGGWNRITIHIPLTDSEKEAAR
jgi:two-component system, LytTR family, sensor kinase